jgi:hypothetical protein
MDYRCSRERVLPAIFGAALTAKQWPVSSP